MSEIPLTVIRYCAEETERQEDGPVAVYHMAVAWDYARSLDVKSVMAINAYTKQFNDHIMKIAHLVAPEANPFWSNINLRRTAVLVGDDSPPDWHEVPGAFSRLVSAAPRPSIWGEDAGGHLYDEYTNEWHPYAYFVDRWLKGLLDLHPWQDGNGRTASIVRNMMCGTLMEPEPLPYYYGDR